VSSRHWRLKCSVQLADRRRIFCGADVDTVESVRLASRLEAKMADLEIQPYWKYHSPWHSIDFGSPFELESDE
jgi:hypothetical protein